MLKIKYLSLLLTLILNVITIKAETDETITGYGIKAGVNLATLNGEDAYLPIGENLLDPTSKISFVAGVFSEFHISEKFTIQPELLLSMKGVTFDANEYLQSWSLWYLEVPVLFKSVFDMENGNAGSIYAGPALAYKVKSTYSIKDYGNYRVDNEEMAGINDFDFSAVVGAGFDMEAFKSRLGIDLRYTYGLVNIQKSTRRQNGAISISLYYVLGYKEF